MSVRILAFVLVLALAVPAALLSLRRGATTPGDAGEARPLDALWAIVPLGLLAALIGFAAAA